MNFKSDVDESAITATKSGSDFSLSRKSFKAFLEEVSKYNFGLKNEKNADIAEKAMSHKGIHFEKEQADDGTFYFSFKTKYDMTHAKGVVERVIDKTKES